MDKNIYNAFWKSHGKDRDIELVCLSEASVKIRKKQTLPEIEVKNPMEHNTWDQGKYTTYQIVIATNHPSFNLKSSSVRRRFSEVLWLRKVLKTIHKTIKIPKAPPRKITSERFNPDFIRGRQKAIAEFLNEIIKTDTLLSDTAVHLFLQSDLTTHEIDNYFQGLVSQEVIDNVWERGGHLHQPNRNLELQQITKTQDQEKSSPAPSTSENIPLANGSLKSNSSNSETAQLSDSCNSKSSSETYNSVSGSIQNISSDAYQEPDRFADLSCGILITTEAEINSFDSDSSVSIKGII